MSIGKKILELLETPQFRYKGMSVNCFGLPVLSDFEKQSVKNSLSNLTGEKYIVKQGSMVHITKAGQEYLHKKNFSLRSFDSPFKKNTPKNLLVLFDIPEDRRGKRNWFRYQLRKFEYEMLQRSVWVGPSPLPKEFMRYLTHIHLDKCVKTFKLTNPYHKKN